MYIWCSVAMLFTCTLVLSCLASKWGFECETWVVGTNSKILGGPEQTRKILTEASQQEVQSNYGSRPWRTYLRGASSRYPFKYVPSYDCIVMRIEENCHESPIVHYLVWLYVIIHVHRLDTQYWSMFIFSRLKINHDSHEFILEFSTIANSYNAT